MKEFVAVFDLEDLPLWANGSRSGALVHFDPAWAPDSVCVLDDRDRRDWTDEELDDPGRFPEEARRRGLSLRLQMAIVEEVLANATEQLGREPDLETWLVCLQFFFENDAFLDLTGR